MKENSDGTILTYVEYLKLIDLSMKKTLKQANRKYTLCATNIMNKEEKT